MANTKSQVWNRQQINVDSRLNLAKINYSPFNYQFKLNVINFHNNSKT